MRILFIGDIVGQPGREIVKDRLDGIKKEKNIDFTIANGENISGGLGITPNVMDEMGKTGIDVFTSGNHVWKRKEILDVLDRPDILRPANYPDEAPGSGSTVLSVRGTDIAVINIQGRVFMDAPVDCPFKAMDRELKKIKSAGVIIVDFHAEATSEKIAMGWYLDGKVSAMIGTHTHVQTSDSRILPMGTGYLSDAGMTGSRAGVIGVDKEEIIRHFITGLPFRYRLAKGDTGLEGVIVEAEDKSGRCLSVEPLRIT